MRQWLKGEGEQYYYLALDPVVTVLKFPLFKFEPDNPL
jgi:hypothetical protein